MATFIVVGMGVYVNPDDVRSLKEDTRQSAVITFTNGDEMKVDHSVKDLIERLSESTDAISVRGDFYRHKEDES